MRWIIAFAPLGVFALMLGLASRVGGTAAGALGYFVLTFCALLFVQTVALYPIAVILVACRSRISRGRRFRRRLWP